MKSDEYKTISGESTGLYKEKGSKFIAIARIVENMDQMQSNLTEIKKSYHDARHHCYAYRMGEDGDEFRVNDDGEPSGTAGKPIYNQILSHELTNILVVVVRYFGGTKLGTSGLIRAYKTATSEALNQAGTKINTILLPLGLSFPYTVLNDVMRVIKEEGVQIKSQDFTTDCKIQLLVRKSESERITNRFTSIYPVESY